MYGGTIDAARRQRFRLLAILAAVLVSVPYLWVGYNVLSVVGDATLVTWFLTLGAAAVGVAFTLSGRLPTGRGIAIAGGVLLVGVVGYFLSVPATAIRLEWLIKDVGTLLAGLSVFQILRADVWIFAITPAPLFASWYLVFGRRYTLGALVGASVVSFFLMTGDLGTTAGLVAAVGVIGVVGFGRLELEGGTERNRDALLSLIAVVFVVTATVSLVSTGAGSAAAGGGTVESSLIANDDRLRIQGSISLSPEERFEVRSTERSYWRVGAFDRYTGRGWVKTGGTTDYDGRLRSPPGETETIEQSFEMQSRLAAVPAAWKPVEVSVNARAQVTSMGGFQPRQALGNGERYTVRSLRPDPSTEALRAGGEPYPDRIENRYLDLPASTPDRLTEFTDRVTADAEDPYEAANAIEAWLEANKNYSLEVDRPSGDIASSFLFGMDRGYCTYFATAMVSMLRSQGVPARFAVGYTPGEQVGENRWLARGLDSHAWVEVYFSDVGWVRFDPTPAEPRRAAERQRLNGDDGPSTGTPDGPTPPATTDEPGQPPGGTTTTTGPPVGPPPEPPTTEPPTTEPPTTEPPATQPPTTEPPTTEPPTTEPPNGTAPPTTEPPNGTAPPTTEPPNGTTTPPTGTTPPATPTESPTEPPGSTTEPPGTPASTPTDPSIGGGTPGGVAPTPGAIETPPSGGPLSALPDPGSFPRDTLPTGLFLLGGVTLLVRVRARERIRRARWLRADPTGTPTERVEGTYERLEYLLSRRFRPRRAGETPREYVDAVCQGATAEAARTVLERYEDARYAGTVTEADAAAARDAFDALYTRLSAVSWVYGID
jgi:transglutaminase-like putative cysteine protease